MSHQFELIKQCPACLGMGKPFASNGMECLQCGLHYRNPRPNQAAILRSYNSGATFAQWQNELTVREYLWHKRLKLLLKHRTEGTLLDVGTGDGFFLKFATQHYQCVGVEISESGVEFARKNGINVIQGGFRRIEAKQQFDVITLWHVLEHLPFPGKALKDLRSYLKPDGIIAIAVPNESRQLSRFKKASSSEKMPFDRLKPGGEIHLTFFTPEVLKQTIRAKGYEVLEFGVDDVALERSKGAVTKLFMNQLVNSLTGKHSSIAMYIICKKLPLVEDYY